MSWTASRPSTPRSSRPPEASFPPARGSPPSRRREHRNGPSRSRISCAASTRPPWRRMAWPVALRELVDAAPIVARLDVRANRQTPSERSRRRFTSSAPRPSRTRSGTPAPRLCDCRSSPGQTQRLSASRTTAWAVPTSIGAQACVGYATVSRRWAGAPGRLAIGRGNAPRGNRAGRPRGALSRAGAPAQSVSSTLVHRPFQ